MSTSDKPYCLPGVQVSDALKGEHFCTESISTTLVCCVFFFTFRMLSRKLSRAVFPGYKKLCESDKVQFDDRMTSQLHALLVIPGAVWCTFNIYHKEGRFLLNGHTDACDVYMLMTMGYMMQDLVLMIWYYSYVGNIAMVIHHLATMAAMYLVVAYQTAQFYAMFGLITEASTVFLNMRWFLWKMKMGDSKFYMYNGYVLFLVFFVVRAVGFIIVEIHIIVYREVIGTLPVISITMLVMIVTMFLLLNWYWFSLILKGVVNTLRKKGVEDDDEDEERDMLGSDGEGEPDIEVVDMDERDDEDEEDHGQEHPRDTGLGRIAHNV